MPVTFHKIANNTADVSLNYEGDTINLLYYPGRMTDSVFAQMKTIESSDTAETVLDGLKVLNDALAHLLKSWDIYEDDTHAKMYPIDAEHIAELPVPLRMQILYALMSDMRPEAIATQTIQN